MAEVRSRVPSLRERLVDNINRIFFSDDRAGRDEAEYILSALDLTPLGIPDLAYTTGQDLAKGDWLSGAIGAGALGIPAIAPIKRALTGAADEVGDITKVKGWDELQAQMDELTKALGGSSVIDEAEALAKGGNVKTRTDWEKTVYPDDEFDEPFKSELDELMERDAVMSAKAEAEANDLMQVPFITGYYDIDEFFTKELADYKAGAAELGISANDATTKSTVMNQINQKVSQKFNEADMAVFDDAGEYSEDFLDTVDKYAFAWEEAFKQPKSLDELKQAALAAKNEAKAAQVEYEIYLKSSKSKSVTEMNSEEYAAFSAKQNEEVTKAYNANKKWADAEQAVFDANTKKKLKLTGDMPGSPFEPEPNLRPGEKPYMTAEMQRNYKFGENPEYKIPDEAIATEEMLAGLGLDPQVLYHSSGKRFGEFHDPSNLHEAAIFATPAKDASRAYGENIYPVHFRQQNPRIVTDIPHYNSEAIRKHIKEAKAEGQDSLIIKGMSDVGGTYDQHLVFSNNQIRSVWAKMDPAKIASPDLMAGLGGAAVLAPGMFPADAEAAEAQPVPDFDATFEGLNPSAPELRELPSGQIELEIDPGEELLLPDPVSGKRVRRRWRPLRSNPPGAEILP